MKSIWPFAAALAGLTLAACGDDKAAAPAAAPAAAAPKKTADKVVDKTAAAPVQPYVYTYSPTGKRDPFRPATESGPVLTQVNCDEPLCQYDMDQLTLVAVVTGDSNPVAMVEDTAGHGYIVHKNSRMGKAGGRVTQILHDSLTVTEMFTGPDGKVVPNPVNLAIKADKDKEQAINLLNNKAFNPANAE